MCVNPNLTNLNNNEVVLNSFSLRNLFCESSIPKDYDLSSYAINLIHKFTYHYNSNHETMYPSQEYLQEKLNACKQTVIKALDELYKKGLLIKIKKGKRNHYKFTPLFFHEIEKAQKASELRKMTNRSKRWTYSEKIGLRNRPKHISNKTCNFNTSSCDDINSNNIEFINAIEHDKENIKKLTNPCNNDDDEIKKLYNLAPAKENEKGNSNKPIEYCEGENPKHFSLEDKQRYKKLLQKLESWNFSGGQFVIKKIGIDELEELCKFVEDIKPSNPGGYLRTLVNMPDLDINKFKIKEKTNNYNQNTGINYKTPEITRREIGKTLKADNKTPKNDLETAKKYILDCADMTDNDTVRKKVQEIQQIWNL
jgi:predicted transcriptional regulator